MHYISKNWEHAFLFSTKVAKGQCAVNLVTLGEWEAVARVVAVVFCQVANKRWHVGESSVRKQSRPSYIYFS